MMTSILAIDLGTSALKAIVYDESLTVLGEASAPIHTHRAAGGVAEQQAEQWLDALALAAPEALRAAVDLGPRPSAIAFTGHMSAPVFTTADGTPLTAVQTIADTRSQEFVETDIAFHDLVTRATGNVPATHFGLPKILWALANISSLAKQDAVILAPKDFLRLHMGGSLATEASDAGNLLLIDPVTGNWHSDIVSGSGVPQQMLPPVRKSSEPDGGLNRKWAAILGLPAGIPLITGAADMATAAAAGGLETPGRVLITVGTSATALAACPAPLPALTGKMTFHTTSTGQAFALGSHFNGGACLDWFHRVAGPEGSARHPFLTKLSEAALQREPRPDDPLFLSTLLGSGTPRFDGNERGAFLGLSASHDKTDLFRAVLEGISFDLCQSLELLRTAQIEIDHILAGGGGMKLSAWPQILADVSGVELRLSDMENASARGAAIIGFAALGKAPAPQETQETVFYPDPHRHSAAMARKGYLDNLRATQQANWNALAQNP